jgi:hypothetical protein
MPTWLLLTFFAFSSLICSLTLYLSYALQKKYRAQCLILFEPEKSTVLVNGKSYRGRSPLRIPTKIGLKLDILVKKPGYLDHSASFTVRSSQSFYYCQLKKNIQLSVIRNKSPETKTGHRRPQLKLVNSQT